MTKSDIEAVLKNPNDKLFAIDLDGTLCDGEFWGETEPTPNTAMIARVWQWYIAGAHIVIYTARQPKWYPETHAWLVKHCVPFHGIAMTLKPGADIYIDDKSCHPEDVLERMGIEVK